MTTGGKPPTKSGPFQSDDDAEDFFDAWDATFDSLHADPDNSKVIVGAGRAAPAQTDLELEEQMTLDNALDDDLPIARKPSTTAVDRLLDTVPAPDEFRDAVRASQDRSPTAPPPDDDDLLGVADSAASANEDEVITSASRPMRAPSAIETYEFDDDAIAPPPPRRPTPIPRTGAVARGEPPARSTPAIVRRTTPARAFTPPPIHNVTPPDGLEISMFAEDTRILHTDEIEAQANASRKPLPASEIDDDAYDDIAIDADAERAAGAESAPVQRRTAHVVRRASPTRPPFPRGDSPVGAVIEIDVEDEPAVIGLVEGGDRAAASGIERPPTLEWDVPGPSGLEDDFSDVAAAVGAASDDDLIRDGLEDRHVVDLEDIDLDAMELDTDFESEPSGGSDLDDPLDTLGGVAPLQLRRPAAPRTSPHDQSESVNHSGSQPLSTQHPTHDPIAPNPTPYPRVKTPTSVPPLGPLRAAAAAVVRDHGAPHAAENEPMLDVDSVARGWPEQAPLVASSALDEVSAAALLVYEREVATLDESATSAALRIEAARLCERLSDLERARVHYDAALLADPRATAALRGLRRIARASGDLAEATRYLDSEIAVAGALERRPLGHYRVDLLMASGEQDLARVAVGEILDNAPSDIRALLAQLELAFLDGRADEFGVALEQIAQAVSDPELRAAAQSVRGALAAHHNDAAAAVTWFSAAAESDPQAIAPRLGAVRQAVARADGEAAAAALLDLARQVEANDRITAAATAIRAQEWAMRSEGSADEDVGRACTETRLFHNLSAVPGSTYATSAAALATAAAGSDPLVARLAAETPAEDRAATAAALAHWASIAKAPSDRGYAAARAAEFGAADATALWTAAIKHDPDDDYAAAQLRTAHDAAQATQAAIAVDLAISADPERERARLRAAYGLIARGELADAIDVLSRGRAARPGSLPLAEALAEALGAANRWEERARLFGEVARDGGQFGVHVIQRCAIAWDDAVNAAQPPDAQRVIAHALEAWERVLEHSPSNPVAHAAAIALATRLGDREVLAEVLARTQAALPNHVAAWGSLGVASLAFRRARLIGDDAQRAALLRDTQPLDDPRRTVALVVAAAHSKDLAEAAAALEERANQLDRNAGRAGSITEIAALRLRAAQLVLDANDAPRAVRLLQQVEHSLPTLGAVPDLLAAARRRAGDRPSAAQARRAGSAGEPSDAGSADAFVRLIRDGDLAALHGEVGDALALYQRALELKPGDPLAAVPLIRAAIAVRDPAPLTALALAQLRDAGQSGDGVAKAAAYELLAQIEIELRDEVGAGQIALESASQADPSRVDLMHRLERQYAVDNEIDSLLRIRKAELETIPAELARDRSALQLDLAGLATRDGRPELELAEIYRAVLATDPKARLALLHLESIVRRDGASEDLARLEDAIADYFDGDARSQAAFWTRAGETHAELGQIDAAVERFGRAEAVLPGHIPALEGWCQAALKGALWIDVAAAATRQALGTADPSQRAALHHFAGVTLMDKALVGDQAMVAFHRALDADPGHKDAFLRLRILHQENAHHDDLATLLARRLEVETDRAARIELHRALAELHRNFLSDREIATEHYRAILADDPNDLRSHAAVADIAWEQGNWQEAADALMARARLEREPEILKTLCFRLGLIYADRLVDVPMALKAFQRALSYEPNDESTLVRLADLAVQIGEWKLALGACERLVKNEGDADRRVVHLHRVANIFQLGFNDTKRAERALNLALDNAPTNDEALQRLVEFYKTANDLTSARVHLNRVAGAMRARVAHDPLDGTPYRVIARAMAARANTNAAGSGAIARAAAQLADLLGAAGEPEQLLLAEPARGDASQLIRPEVDDVLFPPGVQVELRQVFQLLGDRFAKHVGVNVQAYGVSRGDRVRAKDSPVASVAQVVATALGYGEIDIYLSNRQPWVMVAEPTSPVSLILGAAIARSGGDAIRFAAGGALKMAQASLAIPARLASEELGVLVVALLRLFQPDFPAYQVDPDAVATQLKFLGRLIPKNLLHELKPFALAIDGQRFGHRELSRDLKIATLRAGLVASGSIVAGLRILAAQADAELPGFLANPVAQQLVGFALGEDHAAIVR